MVQTDEEPLGPKDHAGGQQLMNALLNRLDPESEPRGGPPTRFGFELRRRPEGRRGATKNEPGSWSR